MNSNPINYIPGSTGPVTVTVDEKPVTLAAKIFPAIIETLLIGVALGTPVIKAAAYYLPKGALASVNSKYLQKTWVERAIIVSNLFLIVWAASTGITAAAIAKGAAGVCSLAAITIERKIKAAAAQLEKQKEDLFYKTRTLLKEGPKTLAMLKEKIGHIQSGVNAQKDPNLDQKYLVKIPTNLAFAGPVTSLVEYQEMLMERQSTIIQQMPILNTWTQPEELSVADAEYAETTQKEAKELLDLFDVFASEFKTKRIEMATDEYSAAIQSCKTAFSAWEEAIKTSKTSALEKELADRELAEVEGMWKETLPQYRSGAKKFADLQVCIRSVKRIQKAAEEALEALR